MRIIKAIGIDLGKNVFHLHGRSPKGETVLETRMNRRKLKEFMEKLPPCQVGMEACGGTHYWARVFIKMGHQVRIMPGQFVKPYVKSNKNDWRDAEAICEAMGRPGMRFVGVKTEHQQEIQALHRIRTRLIRNRTALLNETRSILFELGIVTSKGKSSLASSLKEIVASSESSPFLKKLMGELQSELRILGEQISKHETALQTIYREDDTCQRIGKIPGIGPITATALIASIGDPRNFKNGRQMSAYLGLVPRQYSTGGRSVLRGISKRGDSYLRCLLIHGARSVVQLASRKQDPRNLWIQKIVQTRGFNKACVALANKNARIIWTLWAKQQDYQAA